MSAVTSIDAWPINSEIILSGTPGLMSGEP
jgi:hypothetical protein